MGLLFIVLAILIVAGLAAYAMYLLLLLKKQKLADLHEREIANEKRAAQTAMIVESLRVISANVIDENLNLSEATLRCKHLLDGLLLSEEARKPYLILDVVFDQIQGFATHQARNELTLTERNAQDKARESIENTHEEALKACFTKLRTFEVPS